MDPATFAGFTGLAGQETALFEELLADLGGVGVEIGCLDGFSTLVILKASKLNLTSIDPLIADSMESSLKGDEPRLRSNLEKVKDRWTFIKDFSHKVAPTWTTPLDFLFIDGDHSIEAVTRDYDQWVPFLKVGGILAIHDSRMSRPGGAGFHPGPSKLAAERIFGRPAWKVIGEQFSLTVAVKL
jgi:predicted O-methyltransferase YrrM